MARIDARSGPDWPGCGAGRTQFARQPLGVGLRHPCLDARRDECVSAQVLQALSESLVDLSECGPRVQLLEDEPRLNEVGDGADRFSPTEPLNPR